MRSAVSVVHMQNRVETTIENVVDYLKWVKETLWVDYKDVKGNYDNLKWLLDEIYYRGQSDATWNLYPSIHREYKSEFLNEFKIIGKASQVVWSELNHYQSYIDKLIYLQHYGLRTRLLDVTFNPLVALYFACEENSGNGIVYCGHKCNFNYEKDIPEISAKYLFTHQSLDKFYSWCKKEGLDIKNFTIPLFIHPPMNNPRIESQNGAFVMSPLIKPVSDKYKANKGSLEDFFENRVAIIPSANKNAILKELSMLGINSGTIFNDVTKKLQTIMLKEIQSVNKDIDTDDFIQ